jgi:hypothetical protein
LIVVFVAWLPKHLDPFGIYRLLSPPSNIFLTVNLTVTFARPGTELPVFKYLQVLETIEWE